MLITAFAIFSALFYSNYFKSYKSLERINEGRESVILRTSKISLRELDWLEKFDKLVGLSEDKKTDDFIKTLLASAR